MRLTTRVELAASELTLSVSATSDTGSVRLVNEDSYIAEFPLFVVADGMGGHARGDQASQTAIAVLGSRLVSSGVPSAAAVVAAIGAANTAVVELSEGNEGAGISGTTLAGISLVLADDGASAHWMAFNIGDSRIYTWNGRRLQQLSVDHSAVQELVDAGALTELEAREHPDRNVITRAIGVRSDVDADVWLLPVASLQAFLLCSDGLTKELDDEDIASLISAHGADPLADLTETLVEAAKRKGGHDNITAVFVELQHQDDLVVSDSTSQRDTAQILEDTTPRL
jgi:serine/threonine protein phosphatase PrpC